MKTKDILEWICRYSINGEFLNIIEVPEEGENEWEQNEQWWINMFGFPPPCPVAAGRYLYFYATEVNEDMKDIHGNIIEPDAKIEILNTGDMFDCDYVLLYKLEW